MCAGPLPRTHPKESRNEFPIRHSCRRSRCACDLWFSVVGFGRCRHQVRPHFRQVQQRRLDFNTRTGCTAASSLAAIAPVSLDFRGAQLDPKADCDRTVPEQTSESTTCRFRCCCGSTSATIHRAFAVYGIAGPAVDIKIADEVEGITLDDGFEGVDVSLVFGGGIEVARIIVEGRYTKGFRRINKLFEDFTEVKSQAFTILFGVRFN